ncbi:MAG: exodeoxyribonuclease VII small subunit [Oscillospiraceae bacterium]|nr:exodeoxyribonuclease VII small subunit [Oscillospiraceae bacterium]
MVFEDGIRRLAEITQQLESGKLSLEESVALYGEGAKLAADCKAELENAKLKVASFGENASDKAETAAE